MRLIRVLVPLIAVPALTAVLAVTAETVATPTPAAAQGSGDTGYDDGYVFAGYEEQPVSVTTVNTTRPRTPTRWCVHWPDYLPSLLADLNTPIESLAPEEVRQLSRAHRGTLVDGRIYHLICYRTGESTPYYIGVIEYRRRDPTGGQITTIETVSEHARELVDAPPPAITTSPPPDRLVVGFETWLATPDPLDATRRSAQAGHLWAIAEPVPIAITYDLGDGTVLHCSGPPASGAVGVSRDERPDCARHTYLDSRADSGIGSFTVTAVVTYDVWLVTSEDPTPRLADTIDGPPTELPVIVREIQAVIR